MDLNDCLYGHGGHVTSYLFSCYLCVICLVSRPVHKSIGCLTHFAVKDCILETGLLTKEIFITDRQKEKWTTNDRIQMTEQFIFLPQHQQLFRKMSGYFQPIRRLKIR